MNRKVLFPTEYCHVAAALIAAVTVIVVIATVLSQQSDNVQVHEM